MLKLGVIIIFLGGIYLFMKCIIGGSEVPHDRPNENDKLHLDDYNDFHSHF